MSPLCRERKRKSEAPRRILMTADAVGGVWQYCLELAAGLCRAGSEVWMAVMGPAPSQGQLQSTHIAGLRILHGDFRLEWMVDAEADLGRAGDWLLTLADALRPDIVHLNGYAHAALPWRRPVVVVAHSCVITWWRAVHRCEAPQEWDRYRNFVARGLEAADLVIAPTLAFLRALRATYRFDTPSCAIWNGRSRTPESTGAKQRVVMTAGRLWDAAKNVAILTRAAEHVPYPIWVAGADMTQDCPASVLPLGRLDECEMRQRLADAMVFAIPARYEPFGLTAVEAAQARCALVLGDIDTQRELWDGAAIFVPPDDSAALARHLNRLLEQPQLAAALGALAHRRASRFTAERMVHRYLHAYGMVNKSAQRRTSGAETSDLPRAHLHTL
ncbi:glycosyltransferase family 4 protein [Dongia deserti]|uniref:glycosyltransferase family 4 protein n=1 Tax=Dongia deserti TaxID=2268030 RepID=UPI000E6576FB|nr:glycosyltransferase family 4 protein [Dongia deserti]